MDIQTTHPYGVDPADSEEQRIPGLEASLAFRKTQAQNKEAFARQGMKLDPRHFSNLHPLPNTSLNNVERVDDSRWTKEFATDLIATSSAAGETDRQDNADRVKQEKPSETFLRSDSQSSQLGIVPTNTSLGVCHGLPFAPSQRLSSITEPLPSRHNWQDLGGLEASSSHVADCKPTVNPCSIGYTAFRQLSTHSNAGNTRGRRVGWSKRLPYPCKDPYGLPGRTSNFSQRSKNIPQLRREDARYSHPLGSIALTSLPGLQRQDTDPLRVDSVSNQGSLATRNTKVQSPPNVKIESLSVTEVPTSLTLDVALSSSSDSNSRLQQIHPETPNSPSSPFFSPTSPNSLPSSPPSASNASIANAIQSNLSIIRSTAADIPSWHRIHNKPSHRRRLLHRWFGLYTTWEHEAAFTEEDRKEWRRCLVLLTLDHDDGCFGGWKRKEWTEDRRRRWREVSKKVLKKREGWFREEFS